MPEQLQRILTNAGRWLTWGLFACGLIGAPLIFNQGASLSILSQMCTVMIFALSYNMLLGQGGMLSFGHAVYSGLGAFVAIHSINMATAGALWLPVSLVPLVGGLAGAFFGMIFGYLTTRKSGVAFSMITLGIVELVSACALMFSGFFGGESGISTNRVIGEPFLDVTYGPQIEVYYLIAFWLFVSTAAMYAFTRTPLGRLLNAVRDNPERVAFIGYDPRWIRYLTLILSGFFAGISGGLSAINFELVSAENVSVIRSGMILLFTVIGGIGFFFGPMIGTVVGVFLTVMLSDFTKAWQLYLGAFFMAAVMFTPNGLAGVVARVWRVLRYRKFGHIWLQLGCVCAMTLVMLLGAIMIIELTYRLTLNGAGETTMSLFGFGIDAAEWSAWLMALLLIAIGGMGLQLAKKPFIRRWDEVNAEIEEQARRRSA